MGPRIASFVSAVGDGPSEPPRRLRKRTGYTACTPGADSSGLGRRHARVECGIGCPPLGRCESTRSRGAEIPRVPTPTVWPPTGLGIPEPDGRPRLDLTEEAHVRPSKGDA